MARAANLRYFTDAKGNTIEHRYDELNRLDEVEENGNEIASRNVS